MTKYKKLTRSSFVIVALCLALVGILAFGGTYAYFTAKGAGTGNITMGTLGINETITVDVQTSKVVPGQDALKAPVKFSSSDKTNIPMMMLAKVEITAETGATIITKATFSSDWEAVADHEGFYAYKGSGYKTAGTASEEFTLVENVYVDRTNGNDIMGKTLTVTVTVWAMQADFVGTANGATTTLASAADVYTNLVTYFGIGGATGGPTAA